MALTLTGADRGELPARGHLRPQRLRYVLGLATELAKGHIAGVGAVQAEAHAPAHLGDIGLGEIRIRARRTGLQTREAIVDAPGKEIALELGGSRMSLEDLLRDRCCGHGGLLSAAGSGMSSWHPTLLPWSCADPCSLGGAARPSRSPGGRSTAGR